MTDFDSVEPHHHWDFALHAQPDAMKRHAHRLRVDGLHKSEAKLIVHAHETADDPVTQFLLDQPTPVRIWSRRFQFVRHIRKIRMSSCFPSPNARASNSF